ncbi:DUF6892 domain-containing protein [Streptomyces sp. NPDC017949]|uniref:DUF6892 domain-containing protein n=1 Tax=Streptomyces sp. NPDC017949 TaxID=3365020 RepID=UPI0037BB3156
MDPGHRHHTRRRSHRREHPVSGRSRPATSLTSRAPCPALRARGAPAWDGEDDLFDVRSLDALALLPNLREVTFVEDGVLAVPDAADIFAPRGIDTD